MSFELDHDKIAALTAGIEEFRQRREAERAETERAEAERAEAERAIRPQAPDVPAAALEAAKPLASELVMRTRAWADRQAKANAAVRELNGWSVPACTSDGELEILIALRDQLQAELGRFSFEARGKIEEKLGKLDRAIDDAVTKADLFSPGTARFETGLFGEHFSRCARPCGRTVHCFVVLLARLNEQTQSRLRRVFASYNVGVGQDEHGRETIAIPANERLLDLRLRRVEYVLPDGFLSGRQIVETTAELSAWERERGAEREREREASEQAAREQAARERADKQAAILGAIEDDPAFVAQLRSTLIGNEPTPNQQTEQ